MFGWLGLRAENKRLRDELAAAKAAAPQELIADGGGPGIAGTQVNLSAHREQLRHFTGHQFTAISTIAKRIAGQEIFVARQPTRPRTTKSANGLEPLPGHALLDAINDPNEFMVRWSLLFATVAALQLTGRAYWWLRDNGERLEIWPLPPDWVTPEHGERLFARWKIRPTGAAEPFTLAGDDVAYFSLPDPADPLGAVSPLGAQARAVDADEAIQQAQVVAFRNGIAPGMAIKVGGMDADPVTGKSIRPELTPEQRLQLISAVRKAYAGVTRRNEPLILDRLIESVTPLFTAPAEMDFLESGKATKSRIFEAFGVNPIIAGQVENANRASSWVAEHHFCEGVVNPLLTLLGQVLTAWVAPRFALPGERLTVWFSPCKAHDSELEFAKWKLGVERGLVTPNEYRRHVLNLEDSPDRDANDLILPDDQAPKIRKFEGWSELETDPYSLKSLGQVFREAAGTSEADPDPPTLKPLGDVLTGTVEEHDVEAEPPKSKTLGTVFADAVKLNGAERAAG